MTWAELSTLIVHEVYQGRRVGLLPLRIVKAVVFGGRAKPSILILVRLRQYCFERRWHWAVGVLQGLIETRYGCYISPKAQIGRGLRLPHPIGIVIGDGVVMGDHCMIFQHVTLGATRRGESEANLYPTLGEDVTIFAGAVVLGPIRIGTGATIGANSVVRDAVPEGATAVGAPARIVGGGATGSPAHGVTASSRNP